MNIVPIDSAVQFGEIIAPNSMVRVIGSTHPLNAMSGARIDRYLDAGLTLEAMLHEALSHKPGWHLRRDLIVRIGDYEILEANWSKVKVKPGAVVTFIPRLQGGNALRTVLGLAVAIGAILIAGPLGTAFAETAFALSVGISANVATALIAGGVVPAGPVALDALWR